MNSRTLHRAAGLLDADRFLAPGALLLEGNRVIAADSPEKIGLSESVHVVDHPQNVLIPGLVNAHAHLDLSHLGPVPFTGEFHSWVEIVRTRRASDPHGIGAAVEHGIQLSLAGGVAAVGDIAGSFSLQPLRVLQQSALEGVSFVECFGIGRSAQRTIEWINSTATDFANNSQRVRAGIQPHAPYSCHPDVYRAAANCQLPLSTHLGETRAEIEFTRLATGPLADMLRRIGVWDDSIVPTGLHPVDLLEPVLSQVPCVAAHLNYVDDRHLDLLAEWPITVAYCPRASEYFGHGLPPDQPHPYRRMLDRGIRVAIGTDSILCLETPDRISPWDELRLLHRRDGIAPQTLIALATVNGAAAIGCDLDRYRFSPGEVAGIAAISVDARNPRATIFEGSTPPRWILPPS